MNEKKYSQVRAMLSIARASFRAIIRNPSAVIFSIVFPLVFIIVFGFIRGNTINLDVGIHPECDTVSPVFRDLSGMQNIHFTEGKSATELEELLQKGRLDAILRIRKVKEGETVEVITSRASREKGTFVRSVITNFVDRRNMDYFGKNAAPYVFREKVIEGSEYRMIDFILPGQLGFSILSAGVFGTAFIFFTLRQSLVLKRFFATPVGKPYIILGEALSRLAFSLSGSLIIILIGRFFFGFTLVNGLQTMLAMLLLAALGLVVFMGFGFVISGLAKSESVIPPLANVITLPQFLLCGTFFPIDAFPSWLQVIGKALPLTYLNDALRKVAFEGAGLAAISPQLGVMLIWGIAVYAAAIRFFRWE